MTTFWTPPSWLPAWYTVRSVMVEDALTAMFKPLLPTVQVVNQLPDGTLDTGWTGRLLYIARGGGGITVRHDEAPALIASITNSRTDSNSLIGWVRDVLSCVEDEIDIDMPDGTTAQITEVREVSGPEEVPGAEYDERIVPATFAFTFATPLEMPDYSRYLGS
ncbi:Uncharacterised protein [Mycobacteroides abscessus subsp. bolletii]|uniref:Tail terminator n=1 Tax=Mycobacteroides abscessus subsp. bolletii TaxID=319705 RepID=A0A9Q7SEQ5_9MYCO|nr:hypothetical protein [Mycobacteroides abscessus]SHT86080.1 Uncharacterised protein [Mycobacteroides abscessus subsp. bolletii]SHU01996.1 Uncharacterised protein [Mycobacteroides abscessus subsp. bolletii]SHX43264.1 Uncharacterised protein [Mycobacteroides abscessus subsp. bolletii]SKM64006.1 Uncharacterised protein [Mycobacteroides abscessus subsp. bolletii]SKN38686.1 Uncharacterised protein [Mycobacteroides abscessus subsp. bolletii]